MLESIFTSAAEGVSISALLISTAASLVFGMVIALVYMYKNAYTKGFVITVALMPSIVQLVIMLVNGNIGAGVAVMGAFSLVRFRSVAGGAREIASIFLAMAVGLCTGMGYIAVAAVFLAIISLINIALTGSRFGDANAQEKQLKVVIPEDLDYTGIFDDLFAAYTTSCRCIRVKTTNLGSMYELVYHVRLKDAKLEKQFLDDIRCRNGNLTIVLGRIPTGKDEL